MTYEQYEDACMRGVAVAVPKCGQRKRTLSPLRPNSAMALARAIESMVCLQGSLDTSLIQGARNLQKESKNPLERAVLSILQASRTEIGAACAETHIGLKVAERVFGLNNRPILQSFARVLLSESLVCSGRYRDAVCEATKALQIPAMPMVLRGRLIFNLVHALALCFDWEGAASLISGEVKTFESADASPLAMAWLMLARAHLEVWHAIREANLLTLWSLDRESTLVSLGAQQSSIFQFHLKKAERYIEDAEKLKIECTLGRSAFLKGLCLALKGNPLAATRAVDHRPSGEFSPYFASVLKAKFHRLNGDFERAVLQLEQATAFGSIGQSELAQRTALLEMQVTFECLGRHHQALSAATTLRARVLDGLSTARLEGNDPEGAVPASATLLISQPPYLVQAMKILISASNGRRPTLKDLARAVGVSTRTLQHSMQAFRGQTFLQARRQAVMQAALPKILDTKMSLSAVAREAGGCSLKTLSRDFSLVFGVRPSVVRREPHQFEWLLTYGTRRQGHDDHCPVPLPQSSAE